MNLNIYLVMHRKPTLTRLLAGFLFIFSIGRANSQSFFSAEILPSSGKYGSVSARLIPADVIKQIQAQNFKFDQWSSFFIIKHSLNFI